MRDFIVNQAKNAEPHMRIHELREWLQHYALAALHEHGAFEDIAFIGGTCLRLYHYTRRYSEDLDFSIVDGKKMSKDQILDLVKNVTTAFRQWGIEVNAKHKHTTAVAATQFKFPGLLKDIGAAPMAETNLMIKFEVDTEPPLGAQYTTEVRSRPILSAVKMHDLPSLMAGKLHAILARPWEKGRDWYDLLWYLGNKVEPNQDFLGAALDQIPSKYCTDPARWRESCAQKANDLNWKQAIADVEPFIENRNDLLMLRADQFTKLLGQSRGRSLV